MGILDFLGLGSSVSRPVPENAQTATVRKIVDELDHLEPERARFVACFAYLLTRVARADLQVATEETHAMEQIVREQGELPEPLAILVVQMAKTQNALFGGTENYLVTKEFKRISDRRQKLALLRCLFAVSAADRRITTVEDNVIRQISDELNLEHRDFITVRTEFRDHLAVLQDKGADESRD